MEMAADMMRRAAYANEIFEKYIKDIVIRVVN